MCRVQARKSKKGCDMNYKEMGGIKGGRNAPSHHEHNAKGSDKNPFGKAETKAELLARMKVAADKLKATK